MISTPLTLYSIVRQKETELYLSHHIRPLPMSCSQPLNFTPRMLHFGSRSTVGDNFFIFIFQLFSCYINFHMHAALSAKYLFKSFHFHLRFYSFRLHPIDAFSLLILPSLPQFSVANTNTQSLFLAALAGFATLTAVGEGRGHKKARNFIMVRKSFCWIMVSVLTRVPQVIP